MVIALSPWYLPALAGRARRLLTEPSLWLAFVRRKTGATNQDPKASQGTGSRTMRHRLE